MASRTPEIGPYLMFLRIGELSYLKHAVKLMEIKTREYGSDTGTVGADPGTAKDLVPFREPVYPVSDEENVQVSSPWDLGRLSIYLGRILTHNRRNEAPQGNAKETKLRMRNNITKNTIPSSAPPSGLRPAAL
jgi:hypothetical protein